MIRVVLDTNVVISALLFDGIPGILVRAVIEGLYRSATSPPLLAELSRILMIKFHYPREMAETTVTAWKILNDVVEPAIRVSAVPDDPTDNRVLECALSAGADAIVSGDRHLLTLKEFHDIPIVSPQTFLTHWRLKHR